MSEQSSVPPDQEAEPDTSNTPEPVHYEQETITQEEPDPSPDALRKSLHD
jgi:hypothetical protein